MSHTLRPGHHAISGLPKAAPGHLTALTGLDGDRPVALGLCEPAELAELRAGMAALLDSPAEGQITWGLHQAAYTRAP